MKPSFSVLTHLEQAREELRLRWSNKSLRNEIENALGPHFWPEFTPRPRGVMWRSLPSPDNGFTFFYQMSHWLGLKPFLPEYIQDKFVPLNSEKHGLARIHLTLPDDSLATCDILNWNNEEGKPLSEVILKNGEGLVDLHHRLFKVAGFAISPKEMSDWFSTRRPPVNYYYYYLCHFLAHGVVFEAIFENEDPKEDWFFHKVIYPNIERIEKEFGLRPLIVQLYPPDQTPEEDFYWFSYPPQVNEYLLKWAEQNQIQLKPWKPKCS